MPATRQYSRLDSLILSVTLFLTISVFARAASTNFSPCPLEASLVGLERPGTSPAYQVLVTVATNKFAFPLPRGFRMRSDTIQGKILLVRNDEAWSLTIRVLKPLFQGVIVDSAPYREYLSAQRPSARILEEFPITVAGRNGTGFNLQWKLGAGVNASARVAFIFSPAGILEFGLFTTTDRFSSAQADFNRLLVSFRPGTSIPITVPPPATTNSATPTSPPVTPKDE